MAPILGQEFRIERTFQEVAANGRPTPIAKYAVVVPGQDEDIEGLVERLRVHWTTHDARRVGRTEAGYWLGSYRGYILAFGRLDALVSDAPHDEGIRKKTEGVDPRGVALVELTPR